MDVNEEIVKEWLQLCQNQFLIENISFHVPGNYSDIDFLAVDINGMYYDYEIKWRAVYKASDTNIDAIIEQINRAERINKIREIIGQSKYKKIFITTYQNLGTKYKTREKKLKKFEDNDITVIFFDDIIKQLVDVINPTGKYSSPVQQIIRMLKYFDIIKK